MLKKFIKRFLPDHNKIKQERALSIFGTLLHDPNLWHLNRRSASGAFGIGLFFAFWPVPFQMWLSAAIAIPLRVNLPLSVATVWISNPFTMPAIFYGAYWVGVKIMGAPVENFAFELSWQWVLQSVETLGPAFLLGCAVCSVVFGLAGYFGLNVVWRMSVSKAWEHRQAKRAAKLEQKAQLK
jgi:uncharacterized protein (DUF2062 family)